MTLLLALPGFNQRLVLVAFLLYILRVLAVEFNIDVAMILRGSFDCFGGFMYLSALDRTAYLVSCRGQTDIDVDILVRMHHCYRWGRFNFKHNINQLSSNSHPEKGIEEKR